MPLKPSRGFFSWETSLIPYVEHYSDSILEQFMKAACYKVNGRQPFSLGLEEKKKRRFKDDLIRFPIRTCGIALMDLKEQGRSLRAARAARFMSIESPARQILLFRYASVSLVTEVEDDGEEDEPFFEGGHPISRMRDTFWVGGVWNWAHFCSPTLNSGLYILNDYCRLLRANEGPFAGEPRAPRELQSTMQARADLFKTQRTRYPIMRMTEAQLEHLTWRLPVTPEQAHGGTATPFPRRVPAGIDLFTG